MLTKTNAQLMESDVVNTGSNVVNTESNAADIYNIARDDILVEKNVVCTCNVCNAGSPRCFRQT